MSKNEFIKRKLKQYIAEFDELDEKETEQANYFVLTTALHHINEMGDLISRTNQVNESFLEQIEELKSDVEFYQSFIQENNLGKRYQFYCKQKGVI